MPAGFDRNSFNRALDQFRLTDAEEMVASAGPGMVEDLRAEVEGRRAAAEEVAKQRYQQIVDLGAAGTYAELVGIRHDPSTTPLLALLSTPARARAETVLRDTERWEHSRRRINARRLTEAREALDGLDLQLARGLVAKVDDRFLDDRGIADRDEILLALSARTMEIESLRATGEQLIESDPPKRRRWWHRRRD